MTARRSYDADAEFLRATARGSVASAVGAQVP